MANSKMYIPLTVLFDDLMRHYDHVSNFATDNEFLEFVINQEECRKQWAEAEAECRRLQTQLENSQHESTRQERKIQETRLHLTAKLEYVNKLEKDKEQLDSRISACRTLLQHFMDDPKSSLETRDKLSTVLSVLDHPESLRKREMRSPGNQLDTISEGDYSTDLSMTQSEDDLDVSNARRRRPKRPSLDYPDAKKISSSVKKTKYTSEDNDSESPRIDKFECVSKTPIKTVTEVYSAQPIRITSTYESAMPSSSKSPKKSSKQKGAKTPTYTPSAPKNLPSTESDSDAYYNFKSEMNNNVASSSNLTPNTIARTLSSSEKIAFRPHTFIQKAIVKPEKCSVCEKRIFFSKPYLKCKDCNTITHPDGCRDRVGQCISIRTPSKTSSHIMGTIADYAPSEHPMIPAILLHCINEIEARGMNQVGLYRISGSDKEIKELKEKFFKKKTPNLSNVDIPVLCGCVKDFLRSVREPLIGRWLWSDFTIAAGYTDPIKKEIEFNRIVGDLQMPNQETLAFIILHLQKVANTPDVKMPKENLAKVFGPTIVGYSSQDKDLDGATMLAETEKQHRVVLSLLNFSEEFWVKFLYKEEAERIYKNDRALPKRSSKRLSKQAQSRVDMMRQDGPDKERRVYFPDGSPNEAPTPRPKRRYFE